MHETLTENGNVMDVECESLQDYVNYIENLASNGDFMFRGQNDSEHRLQDSWRRYSSTPHEEWMTEFQDMLDCFVEGLIRNDIQEVNLNLESSIEQKLQIGRHCGLPTPCLDFTYSPYIALFFAFDGISQSEYKDFHKKGQKVKDSVVYAIDKTKLADLWARHLDHVPFERDSKESCYDEFYKDFLLPDETFFCSNDEVIFPENMLKLIPYSSQYNKRMQKQLGCLLYDTLWYGRDRLNGIMDLEMLIEKGTVTQSEDKNDNTPVMYRFFINHRCISDVFSRLEMMNINGGLLYGSIYGVVSDCKNRYFYSPVYMINNKA